LPIAHAMIQISDSAINEIERMHVRQPDSSYLRLAVIAAGCAGRTYDLQFATQIQPTDQQFTLKRLTIVIDPASAEQLQGLAIDYTEDLMGGGFQFTNPQAHRTCSCGNSFAIATDNTDQWTVDCGL
jgi:iron-sulfur cluster assembly protein